MLCLHLSTGLETIRAGTLVGRPGRGGLTRRRKAAGLNFAPVHQLFQQQNDFLAPSAWPGLGAAQGRGERERRCPGHSAPVLGVRGLLTGDGRSLGPRTRPTLPGASVASPVKLKKG